MVDWSNPEEVKEYNRLHYLANKEKIRVGKKKYYEDNKEKMKAYGRQYSSRNLVDKFYKYVGVCICPKCGLKGYKAYSRRYNKKTGNYGPIMTRVQHRHREDGKLAYKGHCYIGMGEL